MNKYQIFDPARCKKTLLSTIFYVRKDPTQAVCWIHGTSLMLLSSPKSGHLGIVFLLICFT